MTPRWQHYLTLFVAASSLTFGLVWGDRLLIGVGAFLLLLGLSALFVRRVPADRPRWSRKLPLRADAYRALLVLGERELLTKPETAKIGAWLRDQRIQAELSSEDVSPLFEEMEAVLLELHKRSILSSADPLWGRIDTVVERLRA
jgi:hypothetical protein